MSVIVKGFEMPKDCFECTLQGNPVCIEHLDFSTRGERPTDCPLVEVPPHGRLIDANPLQQSLKESIDECHKWAVEVEGGEMYARVSQSLATFVECSLRVKAAPTVIPAEEGK